MFRKEEINDKLLYSLRDLANKNPITLRKLFEIGHNVGNVTEIDRQGNPVDGINQWDFPNNFNPHNLKIADGYDETAIPMKSSAISIGDLPPVTPAAPSTSKQRYARAPASVPSLTLGTRL